MIPSVKTWLVSFYSNKTLLKRVYVNTINKRFAYWLANEECGYISINPEMHCTKVTVSVPKFIDPTIETV